MKTNELNAVIAETPREDENEKTREKTPIGANAMTQPISTSMASLIPTKTDITLSFAFICSEDNAKEKSPVKIINERRAPSAAAAIGLTGIRLTSQSLKFGKFWNLSLFEASDVIRISTASGLIAILCNKYGATTKAVSPEIATKKKKSPKV